MIDNLENILEHYEKNYNIIKVYPGERTWWEKLYLSQEKFERIHTDKLYKYLVEVKMNRGICVCAVEKYKPITLNIYTEKHFFKHAKYWFTTPGLVLYFSNNYSDRVLEEIHVNQNVKLSKSQLMILTVKKRIEKLKLVIQEIKKQDDEYSL